MNPFAAIANAISKPITAAVKSRGQVKQIQAKAKAGEAVTDAEWELIGKRLEQGTWKDEFVTLIFCAPVIMQIAGSAIGDQQIVSNANDLMANIPNYGVLLPMVVGAAIALKVKKS